MLEETHSFYLAIIFFMVCTLQIERSEWEKLVQFYIFKAYNWNEISNTRRSHKNQITKYQHLEINSKELSNIHYNQGKSY